MDSKVRKKISGPKSGQVTEEWRKQHNEELCDLYFSPGVIPVKKQRRIRWNGRVARDGVEKKYRKGFGGETEEKRQLGDLDIEGIR
jgi:hypothetical protein